MPCWTAPSIAAALWNEPVDQILKGIEDGSIPAIQELGFLLVDITCKLTCPPPASAAASTLDHPVIWKTGRRAAEQLRRGPAAGRCLAA